MEELEWDVITSRTWPLHLPELLQQLSTCSFVALDFEFSGIASPSGSARRVASLQERYADVKEAAQRFQILQVGLTIAHEDPSGEFIILLYINQLMTVQEPTRSSRTMCISARWSIQYWELTASSASQVAVLSLLHFS